MKMLSTIFQKGGLSRFLWLFYCCTLTLSLSICSRENGIDTGSGQGRAAKALEQYLSNEDPTYGWESIDVFDSGEATVHVLSLTSQKWREYTWMHKLTIIVPKEIQHDGALLLISGGSLRNGKLDFSRPDDELAFFANLVANKNKAITAVLEQVPNQPLYEGLKEDALISYTLHQFKSDADYTWPLLFPMVKSTCRAMDAIEEFSQSTLGHSINRFLLTGASKRGWTTWLTAAVDERVEAIAPVVIDVLNMPVNIQYQLDVWKDYSPQIEDYVNLGLVQDLGSNSYNELAQMIDPYSYRDALDMPKLIVIATNDEYWPVDAVKHYLDDLPGQNFIHYVPNAKHNLEGGESALFAISAFFNLSLNHAPHPELHWEMSPEQEGVNLSVDVEPALLAGASLWVADSPIRDFREAKFREHKLNDDWFQKQRSTIAYPNTGYRAFYLSLTYQDLDGTPYTKSTRMFVANSDEVL